MPQRRQRVPNSATLPRVPEEAPLDLIQKGREGAQRGRGMTPSGGPSSTNPSPASAASAAAAPDSQNQQGARRRRRPGGFMLVVAAGVATGVAAGVAAGVALTVKQMSAIEDISKKLASLSQDQATIKGRLDSLERSALRLPWPRR